MNLKYQIRNYIATEKYQNFPSGTCAPYGKPA